LKHQTPIQALKAWREKKPELFVKKVYEHTGLDTPAVPLHCLFTLSFVAGSRWRWQ